MTQLIDTSPRRPPGTKMDGHLRPIGDPAPGVPVQLELAAGRLSISGASVGALGSWDFEAVDVSDAEDGALLLLDGEQLLFTFDDETRKDVFLDAFRRQPWWAVALPIVGGLAIAATIWFVAV